MKSKSMDGRGPVFLTMATCSATTGIPLGEIKRAKRDGCKCFALDNRIHLYPLLRWLYNEGRKPDMNIVDVAAAKERDLNASAALKESKMKERDGILAPVEYLNKALRETLLPVRQRLMAMPSEIAHNANPADPIHARKACEQWLEVNMPIMQEGKTK